MPRMPVCVSALLLALSPAPLFADGNRPGDSSLELAVGPGARYVPDDEGSDDYGAVPLPYLDWFIDKHWQTVMFGRLTRGEATSHMVDATVARRF